MCRPARHPAGCQRGHPGRSSGPCGHPSIPRGVCAHNPAMLHLPSVQVAPLAPHWPSAQPNRKLLHTLAARVWKLFVLKSPQTESISVLVNCTSHSFFPAYFKALGIFWKPWFLSWSADRQAAKPLWLWELHSSGFSGVRAGMKAAVATCWQLQNNNLSSAAARLLM